MSKIEIPKKVGKYDVRGLVGRGAMGVVYSAVDPALGRSVAIKTMSIGESPHEAELRLRFLREAQAAGQLQHPNIITVHELFEEGDTAYLVMELLEGAALSSLLKRKKGLSLGQKLSIIDQIAAGLSEAHAHKIVHRDLKPSNVFVLRSGVVKVLDFGVAKVGEGELTKAGTVFGTVEYMAPEQVRGQVVTPQADIFSLGVVSYEVLTGRNPFRADTLAASVFKIVSDAPGKLSEQMEVPAEIEALVDKALAKPMDERFKSLTELREALLGAITNANVTLCVPELTEQDIDITKGDSVAMSVEPRVSQWSNVAAQADLLEEVFQRGLESFNNEDYEDCVLKMSQVLDEVPVHAMSLHYLATSEEKLRRKRLDDDARQHATEFLSAMRDAHRQGDSKLVTEKANELLAVDPESLEARWYRRNAEARLRASSVGGRSLAHGQGASSMRTTGGGSRQQTFARSGGSFGFTPPSTRGGQFTPAVETSSASMTSPSSSTSGGGMWVLGGVALMFIVLVGLFLGSFGEPKPAVSADPIQLPGVRDSPFDGLDDDGTVVLQIPIQPRQPAFELGYVIPTAIRVGETTTIGLFGSGFPDDARVSITDPSVSILSATVQSDTHIKLELLAAEPRDSVAIAVAGAGGYRARIELAIEVSEP
jgi:serine/threonine protein kinase